VECDLDHYELEWWHLIEYCVEKRTRKWFVRCA